MKRYHSYLKNRFFSALSSLTFLLADLLRLQYVLPRQVKKRERWLRQNSDSSNRSARDKPALEISNLTVHYGSMPVLWDISLSVPRGNLVGILGPNGAGKSTLIQSALSRIPLSTGQILLEGKPVEKMRSKVAHIPQRGSVDWQFPITVYELVEMGCYPRRGIFSRLTEEDKKAVHEAMNLLNLAPLADRHISQLSGGQQQRAFLARALVQNAHIYLLDEPFSGVDHISEQMIVETLKGLCQEGKTIFVVHHDLMTVEQYFDRLILLNTRLIASGTVKEVFTWENIQETYGKTLPLVEQVLKLSEEVSR